MGDSLKDWVLPGGVTLGQVALADPRLAHALLPLAPPKEGSGEVGDIDHVLEGVLTADACPAFTWRIVNICGTFTSTEPDTIDASVGSVITRDLWIRKVVYTVRRPNAFAGSIFKAQSDHFNKLNPNVNFQLTIRSYWDYVISSDPTPLENIEMVFECVCPIGFVVGCALAVDAKLTLLRALAADEVPYEVCISLHGITLPRRYDVIGVVAAVQALTARGIACCP